MICFCLLLLGIVASEGTQVQGKVLQTIYLDKVSRTDFRQLKQWKLGFLSPKSGELRGTNQSSVVYDFVVNPNDKLQTGIELNITLIFHAYYFVYKIFVCKSEHFSANDSLKTPFHIMDRITGEYNRRCQLIDPIQHPVYSFTGPAFLEVYQNESFAYIPERFSLLSGEVFDHSLFNFTYEVFLKKNDSRKILVDFFSSDASLTKGQPCSLNGRPVLRLMNSFYKFSCECLQGTYGDRCQWGPVCSKNKTRKLCSSHGSCRSTIGSEDGTACDCDSGYEGEDCRFPIFEHESSETRFYYDTLNETLPSKELIGLKIKSLLHCNHALQDEELEENIIIDERYQNVRLLDAGGTFYDDLKNASKECYLEPKCSNISVKRGSNESTSFEWSDVHLRSATLIKPESFSIYSQNHLCCYICSTDYEVFFFKDEIPINLTPIQPLTNPNWNQSSLAIESINNWYPEVCLYIPNLSEADNGRYRCLVVDGNRNESKYYTVSYPNTKSPMLEVEPRSMAVVKNGEARVDCFWEERSSGLRNEGGRIKPQWDISPIQNYQSYSVYPSGAHGSFIQIYNISGMLTITCTIANYSEIGNESVESFIRVINENEVVCESEPNYNIKWPIEQVNYNFTAKCPLGYEGHCVRECLTGNFKEPAVWNSPDCSNCQRKRIILMFRNATTYQKGFLTYLPNPKNLFEEVKEEFEHGKGGLILPGEIGPVVRLANDFLIVPELVPDINVFYSLISLLINTKHSINEKDLQSLQTLLKSFPRYLEISNCFLTISSHENIAFFQQIPQEKNEVFNVSLYLNQSFNTTDILESSVDLNDNFLKNKVQEEGKPNLFKKMNVEFAEGHNSMKRSITILKRPELILPYRKRILGKNVDDMTKYLDVLEFGEVNSPVVQINVYNGNNQKPEDVLNGKIKVTFFPCQLQSASNVATTHCGRFIPTSFKWDLTKCSLSISRNMCTCSCNDMDGWIGLVAIYSKEVEKEPTFITNVAVASGCGLSLLFLLLTAIGFTIQCAQYSLNNLPRLLEITALMIVNSVFLYCAIFKTAEVAHMAVLMIVSVCLVLVIGISVSHQVDIHQKYAITVDRPSQSLESPSFVMLLISIMIAVFLGAMIWVIAKVQKIRLSHAWLPENEDSSLSLTILCFISFLLLFQFVLAVCNFGKIIFFDHNSDWRIELLSSELKKRCILGLLEMIFIFSSVYQDVSVGPYIFSFVSVILSAAFFAFSFLTCSQSSGGTSSSRSSTSKGGSELREKKRLRLTNPFTWIGFRNSYTGVAETETSNVPHDESMELQKDPSRDECEASFNASTNRDYKPASSNGGPNSVTTKVDIEIDQGIMSRENEYPWSASMSARDFNTSQPGREYCVLHGGVGRSHSQSEVSPSALNYRPSFGIEGAERKMFCNFGEPSLNRYLDMKRKKNDSKNTVKKENKHTTSNSYVNVPSAKIDNGGAFTLKNENVVAPTPKIEYSSMPISQNEDENRYTSMNENGISRAFVTAHKSVALDPSPDPLIYFSRKNNLLLSKSQNASPHISRLTENARTRSVDALTTPSATPAGKKKGHSSQFISIRNLLSKTLNGSRHFDSERCNPSEYDSENRGLISEEVKPQCTTVEKNMDKLPVNQELTWHHKSQISS